MSDSNPPSDRDAGADKAEGVADETSKDEQRFNEQLMEALSDQPPSSEPSPPDSDSSPGPGAGPGSDDGQEDGDRESIEEVTLSSPDVIAAESEALEEFYGGTDTFRPEEDDAPNSISLETISATALQSYDEVGDEDDDDSWKQWSSNPPPPDSEPPSLRTLAGHLPEPAPLPKQPSPKDDELFDAIGPDPYNSLSESLRPPPVMKSAPQLIVEEEDENEEDEEVAVPLKRQRPGNKGGAQLSPKEQKERKERDDWADRRSDGRRRSDHRPLVWPCIAFFCLGVVATLVVQRVLGAGEQPIATGPDHATGPATGQPGDGTPANPGEPPPSHEPLAEPEGTDPAPGTAPDGGAPLGSGWPSTGPYGGSQGPYGISADAAAPTGSAPEPTTTAEPTASADTPPGEAPPFDTAAAAAALGAAAGSAAGCADGEHKGSARVSVTFAPSGRATVAIVESGSLLGTPVASCIANVMRNASVPAFSGGPVTVRKKVRVR